MTFYSGPREGHHLYSEGNGFRSREPAVATAASRAAMAPGVLVQVAADPTKVEVYTGERALKGVVYGFANENGDVALTARDAEVIGARTSFRKATPTVVTGAGSQAAVSPAGNLSLNGVVIAIPDASTKGDVAGLIMNATALDASVSGGELRIVDPAGGDVAVAGAAGVLSDLGLVAGTVEGKSRSILKAEDVAALAALGIVVR